MTAGPVLYIDTSALLRALLERDEVLLEVLTRAPARVTSSLTFTEAPRALWRALLVKRIDAEQRQVLLQVLRDFESHCQVIELDREVLERAREQFPLEFVGTLDALHLASALLYAARVGPVAVVSTDSRLRANAKALGLRVLPVDDAG